MDRAALAAVLVRDNARELRLMHEWLDSWAGLGLVVAGTTRLICLPPAMSRFGG